MFPLLPRLRRALAPRRNPWPQTEDANPWLDRRDAPRRIRQRCRAGDFDADTAARLLQWHRNGYVVLPRAIDDRRIDNVLNDFEHFYAEKTVIGGHRKPPEKDQHGHFAATINVHMQSQPVLDVLLDSTVMKWLNLILGREVYGCQTIDFFTGSRRSLHQDHVHMTTRPFGFLAAAWVALEDIEMSSGPLVYVPGSQWLPFIDTPTIHRTTPPGRCPHDHMHEMLHRNILRAGLTIESFRARKGDVLLWHCNLVHGGGPVADPPPSRLSMACHYAAVGVPYYHQWSGLQRVPEADLLMHHGARYLPEYYDADGLAAPSKKVLHERQSARAAAPTISTARLQEIRS